MWMRPLAIAVLALLLAGPLYVVSPLLGGLMVLFAVAGSLWAVAAGLAPRLPKDRYDLGELRRVHEEEEMRALDPHDALGEPEKFVCPHCFGEYDHRLHACPRCGRAG